MSREGEGAGPPSGDIAAVVLAAGSSTRMGARNKLLLEIDGTAMIRSVVGAALGSALRPVVVVVGHEDAAVRRVLRDLPVHFVENERPQEGLSASLRRGIEAVGDVRAAVVFLGDMPWIGPEHVAALLRAFDPESGREICVPVCGGRRGNPVLWSSRFFSEMSELPGDAGAKRLMERHVGSVCEVAIEDEAVLRDVDTREAWETATRSEIPWRP